MMFSTAERIQRLREAGANDRAISAAMGVTPQALWSRIHAPPMRRGKPVSDECHGDCGRWIDRYHVGRQIVKPPDHCGACARAISPEAIEEETERVRAFLGRAMQAGENGERE